MRWVERARWLILLVIRLPLLLLLLVPSSAAMAGASITTNQQWESELQLESRYFPSEPVGSMQFDSTDVSVAYLQDFFLRWGGASIEAQGFLRWDAKDKQRSHTDLRKLVLSYETEDCWGVTEFVHLVDVVNQTDFVEGLDDEQALGQLMLRLQWAPAWGTTELYVLPAFRERTFPGPSGRLHDGVSVAKNRARYRSGAEDQRVDLALRWSSTFGPVDLGVAHFYGTSRDPDLIVEFPPGEPVLVTPYYDVMNQTSIDVQFTTESWLWKLEGLYRAGESTPDFASVTGGFEYSFVGVLDSSADVGLIIEYVYDDRGDLAPTPFANDWVIGGRLALNDVSSTELLLGVVFATDERARFVTLEASRRLNSSLKIAFEARLNGGLKPSNPAYSQRREDFVQARLSWYF